MHRTWTFVLLLILALSLSACGKRVVTTSPGPRPDGVASGASGGKTPATQRPYTINGKTYYPIPSAHGYEEIGLASWYGADFHGKPTSNGEVYDMHAMTAAHKTLPMGTWLEVTNLENGQVANVRVNDRGPFVRDRIIDMSYAGARQLDMTGKGVVKVRLRALNAVPNYDDSGFHGRFYVQIGAFLVRDNAQRMLNDMIRQGYGQSRVQEAIIGGQRFHRVQLGVYSTLERAEKARDGLSRSYPGAFVIAD